MNNTISQSPPLVHDAALWPRRLARISAMAVLASASLVSSHTYAGWNLQWSDEFNTTSLNTADWGFEIGKIRNNELQYYTNRTQNVNVGSGNLHIVTIKENFNGSAYTSGSIETKGKHSIQYGKIEISGKLPYSTGMWPAFWMLGNNIDSVGWPACGEIDILEMIGGGTGFDDKVYGTGHWYDNGHQSSGGNYQLPSGKFADAYHSFWVEWDPGTIRWFMDGINYKTLDITNLTTMSEFHQPFYVKLNSAIGGDWPNSVGKTPDSTTVLPQTYYVDYMRMSAWDGNWETENLPVLGSSGDTHRIIDDTGFSNGRGSILDSDAVNDYVIYKVANISAGTYDVRVRVKKFNTRGTVQMAGARADTLAFSNIGSPQDLYSSAASFVELDFGTWSPGTTSDKAFKFTVTGKNASSTGYSMSFDYIKLVPQ